MSEQLITFIKTNTQPSMVLVITGLLFVCVWLISTLIILAWMCGEKLDKVSVIFFICTFVLGGINLAVRGEAMKGLENIQDSYTSKDIVLTLNQEQYDKLLDTVASSENEGGFLESKSISKAIDKLFENPFEKHKSDFVGENTLGAFQLDGSIQQVKYDVIDKDIVTKEINPRQVVITEYTLKDGKDLKLGSLPKRVDILTKVGYEE